MRDDRGVSESEETGSDRVTVSMPKGYKAALEARVQAGEAPSVSALVTRAVEAQIAREAHMRRIMELRGNRPFTDDELAVAYRVLGVTASSQGAA
jgi:Arc/MetJ-type ribon-helix-helix transcriptional regulator